MKALEQRITGLSGVESLLTAGGGLAGLSLDPLPNLEGLADIDKDDEVFVGQLGDLILYLAPVPDRPERNHRSQGRRRKRRTRISRQQAPECSHAHQCGR